MSEQSLFTEALVPEAPADSHYGLRAEFQADSHPDKVNLVIGAYKDDQGRPWVLPVVTKAAQLYHEDKNQNNEYLPISGEPAFCKAAAQVLLGSDLDYQSRISSFQTISGTGAAHLGAVFLSKFMSESKPSVYLSNPTWDNHVPVFTHAGLPIKHYPYYAQKTKSLDFDAMVETLSAAPRGSIVLLQACAHNPTGLDPTPEQWRKIATVVREAGLFPFFDCAYQGFATGDLANDSFPIRHFASLGLEMFIALLFQEPWALRPTHWLFAFPVAIRTRCLLDYKARSFTAREGAALRDLNARSLWREDCFAGPQQRTTRERVDR
jgi:aspartate aminotransferase